MQKKGEDPIRWHKPAFLGWHKEQTMPGDSFLSGFQDMSHNTSNPSFSVCESMRKPRELKDFSSFLFLQYIFYHLLNILDATLDANSDGQYYNNTKRLQRNLGILTPMEKYMLSLVA